MIKRADEMLKEFRDSMRGGKGTVEIMHIFTQNEMTGKARLFARVTLQPGCSIGMHEHRNEEEVYYIINGVGVVNDNGDKREVKAGDAILTGGGAEHSIENTGDQPLELMAVVLLYDTIA